MKEEGFGLKSSSPAELLPVLFGYMSQVSGLDARVVVLVTLGTDGLCVHCC
jgi:hypothetical protein